MPVFYRSWRLWEIGLLPHKTEGQAFVFEGQALRPTASSLGTPRTLGGGVRWRREGFVSWGVFADRDPRPSGGWGLRGLHECPQAWGLQEPQRGCTAQACFEFVSKNEAIPCQALWVLRLCRKYKVTHLSSMKEIRFLSFIWWYSTVKICTKALPSSSLSAPA